MTDRQRRTVRVENLTDYPTREVQKLVRFACREAGINERYGLSSHRILVRVKYHNGGHAYQGRWFSHPTIQGRTVYRGHGEWADIDVRVPDGVFHLIVCRIPKPKSGFGWPRGHNRMLRGGPPRIVVNDWREALVGITAHEGYHAWQFAARQARRLAGKRARYSEVECEWAEYRILKRMREAGV